VRGIFFALATVGSQRINAELPPKRSQEVEENGDGVATLKVVVTSDRERRSEDNTICFGLGN